jgi:hypothetical protein
VIPVVALLLALLADSDDSDRLKKYASRWLGAVRTKWVLGKHDVIPLAVWPDGWALVRVEGIFGYKRLELQSMFLGYPRNLRTPQIWRGLASPSRVYLAIVAPPDVRHSSESSTIALEYKHRDIHVKRVLPAHHGTELSHYPGERARLMWALGASDSTKGATMNWVRNPHLMMALAEPILVEDIVYQVLKDDSHKVDARVAHFNEHKAGNRFADTSLMQAMLSAFRHDLKKGLARIGGVRVSRSDSGPSQLREGIVIDVGAHELARIHIERDWDTGRAFYSVVKPDGSTVQVEPQNILSSADGPPSGRLMDVLEEGGIITSLSRWKVGEVMPGVEAIPRELWFAPQHVFLKGLGLPAPPPREWR